jgi:deoxycytidylate deaminase
MNNKSRLLSELELLIKNPVDYNSMLNVTINMYQKHSIFNGKVHLCKTIKEEANTGLQLAKFFMDIFIEIGVFYTVEKPKLNSSYHVHKIIKKDYFKTSDILYLLTNNITYSTYNKMHRQEKLKHIFGNELE